MVSSHPPALVTLARRVLVDDCQLERQDHVLVAVSGGGDSIALLHVLALLRRKLGFGLSAHGVDHGLRPEAAAELAVAQALATTLRVPFDTTALRLRAGGNLQARAREARFRALRNAAGRHGANLIATAHHAEDRAETMLMRLLRGAGPRGLAVLPPRDGVLVRPFIRARKAAILAHLARHHLAHCHDPSNDDRRFLRVRVRQEVVPMLESISPAIVQHLCALADQIGGEAPAIVLEANGQPIPLGRAHQEQLRQALTRRSGRSRVGIPGGREVLVEAATGALALVPVASGRGRGRGLPRG